MSLLLLFHCCVLQAFFCMMAFFTMFWWFDVPIDYVYNRGTTNWGAPGTEALYVSRGADALHWGRVEGGVTGWRVIWLSVPHIPSWS